MINEEKGILEGVLRIGIIPTLSPYLLPLFITSFIESFPKINVEIQELITDQIIDKIEKGKLDIGIVVTPTENESLREIPLFYEEFVAYVSSTSPLYNKLELAPEDIDIENVWLLNEGHCFRNQVLNICDSHPSSESKFRFECGSLEALKRIVNNHEGLTFLPELATLDMHEEELEKIRTFISPVPIREVSLIAHKNFIKESLTKALYDIIKASIPDDISSTKSGEIVRWR